MGCKSTTLILGAFLKELLELVTFDDQVLIEQDINKFLCSLGKFNNVN